LEHRGSQTHAPNLGAGRHPPKLPCGLAGIARHRARHYRSDAHQFAADKCPRVEALGIKIARINQLVRLLKRPQDQVPQHPGIFGTDRPDVEFHHVADLNA
jgi:hypothetical protein